MTTTTYSEPTVRERILAELLEAERNKRLGTQPEAEPEPEYAPPPQRHKTPEEHLAEFLQEHGGQPYRQGSRYWCPDGATAVHSGLIIDLKKPPENPVTRLMNVLQYLRKWADLLHRDLLALHDDAAGRKQWGWHDPVHIPIYGNPPLQPGTKWIDTVQVCRRIRVLLSERKAMLDKVSAEIDGLYTGPDCREELNKNYNQVAERLHEAMQLPDVKARR